MVLEALKDNQTTMRTFDYGLLHFKHATDAHGFDLDFKKFFNRLRQRLLNLADTHRVGLLHNAPLNKHLGKGVRLARTTPTVHALVARGLKQGDSPARRIND